MPTLKLVLVMLLSVTSTFSIDAHSQESTPTELRGDCSICNAAPGEHTSYESSEVRGHQVACGTCHHPHPSDEQNRFAVDVRNKCQECHPQAWTRSVFHRLPAATFINCNNCHVPHVWRADGGDCLSCHDNLGTSAGTFPLSGFGSMASFPHARHTDLQCGLCHSSEAKHASLIMTDVNSCMQCHHTGNVVKDCQTCHLATELQGPRSLRTEFLVASRRFNRNLLFDHATHTSLSCSECHRGALEQMPQLQCAQCHHSQEDNCTNCHQPAAPEAHALEVHEQQCRDCHRPQAFEPLPTTRNSCTVCHQQLREHYPHKSCIDCHKITSHGTATGWQP